MVAFSGSAYLLANPDVAGAGVAESDAYAHFAAFGITEGRLLSFDAAKYRAANPDLVSLSDADAAGHYISFGRSEGRLSDADAYREVNTDLANFSDSEAGLHYLLLGRAEGRPTSFDANEYLAANSDLVSAGVSTTDALAHYLAFGRTEGRNFFDSEQYLATYADIAAAGVDAAAHYLASGAAEGRTLFLETATGTDVSTAQTPTTTPTISIATASVAEGDSGTTDLTFTVSLSEASTSAVSVAYASKDGTATAGTDYTAASGTLSIAAGATSGTITVPVTGDTTNESDETVRVTLSSPTNGVFADSASSATATGTITNDDALTPTLSIADASLDEGNSGNSNMTFTVSLSAATTNAVTVAYAVDAATGTTSTQAITSALSGQDVATTSGTLTIEAGSTSGTFNVPIIGDTTVEENETFTVSLTSPTNAVFASSATSLQATGTIVNDDNTVPRVSIGAASVTEGDTGSTTLGFTVSLSEATTSAVSITYATSDDTATAGSDYTAASGTLTIAAGSTTGTINVSVTGDTTDESDEAFTMTLSAVENARFGKGNSSLTATGTITDNDTSTSADFRTTMWVSDVQATLGSEFLTLTSSGLPNFDAGEYNNGSLGVATDQDYTFNIPLTVQETSRDVGTPPGPIAAFLNGTVLFNAQDYTDYDGFAGVAYPIRFSSLDQAGGHIDTSGRYHFHAYSFADWLDDMGVTDTASTVHSPLMGFAWDGVPIYGPRGYSDANDATSAVKNVQSSYSIKSTLDDGRPSTSEYAAGSFVEDYEYISGSGDLDDHNGRFAKTPEYPDGIYAYFMTLDESGTPAYPYIIGPNYYGVPESSNNSVLGNASGTAVTTSIKFNDNNDTVFVVTPEGDWEIIGESLTAYVEALDLTRLEDEYGFVPTSWSPPQSVLGEYDEQVILYLAHDWDGHHSVVIEEPEYAYQLLTVPSDGVTVSL